MWLNNIGNGSHDPRTDGQGLYWPGGKEATIGAVFSDGLIWGGKVNRIINVNGCDFRSGLQPGKILSAGIPDSKNKSVYKIWKIRKDWQLLPSGPEKDAFEYDYNNWPSELGAPYEDRNGDGYFTRGIDKPKFVGDETLWFITNDLDSAITHFTYGSEPIGLEFQTTTFGYNRSDDFADVVFKKYKIINKSLNTVEDMYLGYYSDVDLGDGNDDFVGCDTTLDLGFIYNGDNSDGFAGDGYGASPPALGYKILQGPWKNSRVTDSAFYSNSWHKGFINLKMSSFVPNFKNSSWTYDPQQGKYEGTIEFYYLLNGLINIGSPLIDPYTDDTTKFGLAGDPVNGVGWYEGKGWPPGCIFSKSPSPGDRRLMVTTGSFDFAPNDTQEVVYAIIIARGTDNINSVAELKRKAKVVQEFYDSEMATAINDKKFLPNKFELYQNYPNPFNPSTTISYQLSINSNVTLKLFDVLGKEVATLVNEKQNPGIHHYTLSIINYKLSTGVYFYQLKASDFMQTKKMVILK